MPLTSSITRNTASLHGSFSDKHLRQGVSFQWLPSSAPDVTIKHGPYSPKQSSCTRTVRKDRSQPIAVHVRDTISDESIWPPTNGKQQLRTKSIPNSAPTPLFLKKILPLKMCWRADASQSWCWTLAKATSGHCWKSVKRKLRHRPQNLKDTRNDYALVRSM